VAEKASKFKVDTESRNKVIGNQYRYHKNNRDKRPSMVGEYYASGVGGRNRGSYGNIHYGSNRNAFGSNRAISLDQYGANSRRLSDGIQTVTSDSSVYYNHHHQTQPPTQQQSQKQTSADVLPTVNNSNPTLNKSSVPEEPQTAESEKAPYLNNNNNNNNVAIKSTKAKPTSNSSSTTASTKSLLTRLKNLTGRLTFSFDKDSRRLSNNNISHTIPLKASTAVYSQQVVTVAPPSPALKTRNNNTNNFSNLNPAGPDLSKKITYEIENSARGRALSLDVPPTKYNFSSGGSSNDGSRKSLSSTRNDESLGEDTNSNYTEHSVFIPRKRSSGVDTIDSVEI
jgi:hypothetical protein